MNIKKITKIVLLIIVVSLFNISCTYNDSPTYSSTYSDTYYITIHWNEWEEVVKGKPGHWFKRLNVPNIDREIIDNGLVLVYFKNYEFNNWIQMPYSTTMYNSFNQQFSEEIWFGYALRTLDIDYVYTNPMDMTPRDLELKIVVVRLETLGSY